MTPDSTTDVPRDDSAAVLPDGDAPEQPAAQDMPQERPVFQHPQWMLGVVLIFAVTAIVAGLSNPVWWLIGSPFILVLAIYLWIRVRPT